MSWISNGSLLASANRVPTTLARGRGMPPRFYLRLHPRSISTISSSSSSPFVDDLASTGVIESTLPSTNAVTTLFEPLSTLFLSFPPFLGLSYALCIPLFSLSLRLATSVPIQLWQRKRTQRFAEIVVPQTKIAQELAASELRDASRRAGKSYEEYQIAFRARAIKDAATIAAANKCRPLVTMLAPPLVQIPILMTAILTIRDACQRSLESLPPTAASSSYSESALSHLHDLATTSFLWCPSLALPDPQLLLPLFAGVAFLANVELGAKARAAVMLSVRAGEADRERDSDSKRKVTQKEALERRSRDAIKQWEMNRKGSRSFSAASVAYLSKEIDSARKLNGNERTRERETTAEGFPREDKDRTNRIITNALRVASVALIPVFAAAPAAVCAYILTSNLFTLAQTYVFSKKDQRRELQRVEARRNRIDDQNLN